MYQCQYAKIRSIREETPSDARMQRNESQLMMGAKVFPACVQRQKSGRRDPIKKYKTMRSKKPEQLLHSKACERKTTISSCIVLHCPSLTSHLIRSTLVARSPNLHPTTKPTKLLDSCNSLSKHLARPQARKQLIERPTAVERRDVIGRQSRTAF